MFNKYLCRNTGFLHFLLYALLTQVHLNFRSSNSSRSRCSGWKSGHHLWGGYGEYETLCLRLICFIRLDTCYKIQCSTLFSFHRILLWHCICVTTGRTSGWRSPAPTTRAWPSTVAWWRRFGFLTCFSSTPSALSFMTPPLTTSCWGFILMATSSTVLGKHSSSRT